ANATANANATAVADVVIVRSDSIGDNVLFGGMLKVMAQRVFPGAAITLVCQAAVAPLYEKCPLVRRTFAFDRGRGFADLDYRDELGKEVGALKADLCLNTVYSRDPLNDFLTMMVQSARVGHVGDEANIAPADKAANNQFYNRLIESP